MIFKRKNQIEARLQVLEARQNEEAARALSDDEIVRQLAKALGTSAYPELEFDMWRDGDNGWKVYAKARTGEYFTKDIATIRLKIVEVDRHA